MAAAKKKPAKKSSAAGFHSGEAVSFNYRSAHGVQGTIVGVVKKGTTSASTLYAVQPKKKYIHPGEKVPVHRTGAHLRKRG